MRSWLSALCLALPLAAPAEGPRVRLLVQSSPLAGYRYAEAAEVWPLLREGDALELVREPANAHDANAVRVEWRGRKLGYVPRRQNAALAWGLERGAALRARVSRLSDHPNPARRIEFEVYIE
ncbi:MAG: HIRAN domain-containing protein [Burkholderiales bacterium]|nr:HIRAN domain-containing protein [Burkholderiales bacterium]